MSGRTLAVRVLGRCLPLVFLCLHGAGLCHEVAAPKPAPAPPKPALVAPVASTALPAAPVKAVPPPVKPADGRLLAPDIARIVDRGELVVAMLNTDNPPFFSVKDGQLVGTDVDLGKLIGKELGVPVRFDRSAKTFDGVAEVVARGEADLGISRLARTLKRAKMVQFSTTYMRLPHALLINRQRFALLAQDRPLPQVIRDFRGTIAVIENSSWVGFGKQYFPNATLVPYKTWNDAVAAAKKGEVVAAYRDELEVAAVLKSDPGLALTLRSVTFKDMASLLSIMIGPNDATLQSFVNEVIAQSPQQPVAAGVIPSSK